MGLFADFWCAFLFFYVTMLNDGQFLSQSIKLQDRQQRLHAAGSSHLDLSRAPIDSKSSTWQTTNQRVYRGEPIYRRAKSMADMYFQLNLEAIRSGTNASVVM